MTLSRPEFAHLHEALMNKLFKTYPDMREVHRVQPLYGFDRYAESKYSISGFVFETLKEQGYDFSAFGDIKEKGRRIFQGKTLLDARRDYDDRRPITMSEKYKDAYLTFLQVRNLDELMQKYPLDNLPNKLFHKTDNRGRSLGEPTNQNLQPMSTTHSNVLHIAKNQLDNTVWYLFSWNKRQEKIVRAIIKIETLQNNGIVDVTLTNPPDKGYKPYYGQMTLRHIHHKNLYFELNTQIDSKSIKLNMVYDIERADPVEILIGSMDRSTDDNTLVITDVLMESLDGAVEWTPKLISLNDPNTHPAILTYFNREDFLYKEIKPYVFTYDNLMKEFEK